MSEPSTPALSGLEQSQSSMPTKAGSVMLDPDLAVMSKRFEQYELFDQEKSKFMSELITRYENLQQRHQAMASERTRERAWMLQWQTERHQYEQCIKAMQRAMADNPFIMILIDGDGMVFRNEFLHDGEAGGRRAACQLQAAVQAYIDNESNDIPLGAKIVCRVYAHVRGLGDVLVRSGAVQSVTQFENFVRGFTRSKTLFDFVDVGAGKDRADEKIIESFKLYSHDYHCRRLFFGCSHDNGYARALEESSDQPELLSKVILLEGVPFAKELIPLPYRTKKFPDLFRDTKIVVQGPSNLVSATLNFSPSSNTTMPDTQSGFLNPLPAVSRTSYPVLDSPVIHHALLATFPRTPSTSTLASEGLQAIKPPPPPPPPPPSATMPSWAEKAAAPAPLVSSSPVYQPANREELIMRNRHGQRIDPPCQLHDKTEFERVKKLKLCNLHFLRRQCPRIACNHVHSFEPTKEEIETQRLLARMAPCQNGSHCQDAKCIYGHRCQAPLQKVTRGGGGSGSGGMDTKPCVFGKACKFPLSLHEVDTTVVKTLVIR